MIEYPTVAVAIVLMVVLVTVRYVSRSKRSPLEDPLEAENSSPDAPLRVLIFTAAVAGGHEAAGQAVRAELERAGHGVVMADGLRTMSRTLACLLIRGYSSQLRKAPKSLNIVFAATAPRASAAIVRFLVGLLFASRLLKLVQGEQPDLVVSTYPLVTAALGHLRRNGRLSVPAVTIIPDYGLHSLWVAPGVDLHLVVSHHSAELARRARGNISLARLPVAPGFYAAPARDEARAALGLPQEAFVALVAGGAWGVGDLGGAARYATESGAYAVVVTGENTELKARLEEEFKSEENVRVLGWRKDVPALMAASDCLIQNGVAMTCLEAIEMGLPILFFNPIPGHGELNAHVMEQVGAARWTRTADELRDLLRSATRHEISLPAPSREPHAPTACAILESLAGSASLRAPKRRSRRPRLVLTGAIVVLPCFWLAFSSPVMGPVAEGLHVGVPGYDPPLGKGSLAVRTADPETAAIGGLAERERLPVAISSDAQEAKGVYPATSLTFEVAEESSDGKLPSPEGTGRRLEPPRSGYAAPLANAHGVPRPRQTWPR